LEVNSHVIDKADGTKLRIAEGLCGDETGTIKFRVTGVFAEVI
jgi:hypothetical protein